MVHRSKCTACLPWFHIQNDSNKVCAYFLLCFALLELDWPEPLEFHFVHTDLAACPQSDFDCIEQQQKKHNMNQNQIKSNETEMNSIQIHLFQWQ